MAARALLQAVPSEAAEFLIRIRGDGLEFHRRPWLRRIYDTEMMDLGVQDFVDARLGARPRRKTLLVTGRQCEKSTTLAVKSLTYCRTTPYLGVVHIVPSTDQLREYADEKLDGILADSPPLQAFRQKAFLDNVKQKRYPNRSKILLRPCFLTPDRVRGATGDILIVDEVQDVLWDNMPVLHNTIAHSSLWDDGPIEMYAGTPKTSDSAIQYLWERMSTQNEWLVRCRGCRTHNILGNENLGETGLVCGKPGCRKAIDPVQDGQWVRTGSESADIEGFRLPQLILPYIFRHRPRLYERAWVELLRKVQHYKPHRCFNEIFALPYDAGPKPISLAQLLRCCTGPDVVAFQDLAKLLSIATFMGVDWGGGGDSYTVVTLWAYFGRKLRLVYYKRYEGFENQPDHAKHDVILTAKNSNTHLVGLDFGNGYGLNSTVVRALGSTQAFVIQYCDSSQKFWWDKSAKRFKANRTRVMTDFFDLIRKGQIELPASWRDQRDHPFITDTMAIYKTYTLSRGIEGVLYEHRPGTTDDSFHSGVLALLASLVEYPREDLDA